MAAAMPAFGGVIANLNVQNLSDPTILVDNLVTGLKQEGRSSATLLSSNPTATMPTFSARLAGVSATDTELPHPSTATYYTMRMRINFDIVAAATESWTMQIDQLRRFALTLVADPGSGFQSQALVDLHAASYNVTPGPGGSLTVPIAASETTGAPFGNVDLPVNVNNTQFLFGVGPAAIQLDFSERLLSISYANLDPIITVPAPGQEAGVRFGVPGTLQNVTAEDYPGAGGRVASDDGHFVNVKLTFIPEPTSIALLLAAAGIACLERGRRNH
jgi:hypothetical protein